MTTTTSKNRVAMENDGPRVDARAKVTGAAKYTYDINRPNMIWADHVRAPFANSKLVGINLAAARGIKGVLEVQMWKDRRNTPTDNPSEVWEGAYSGQAVGHVCAESK